MSEDVPGLPRWLQLHLCRRRGRLWERLMHVMQVSPSARRARSAQPCGNIDCNTTQARQYPRHLIPRLKLRSDSESPHAYGGQNPALNPKQPPATSSSHQVMHRLAELPVEFSNCQPRITYLLA
jgi:hypothetical protein